MRKRIALVVGLLGVVIAALAAAASAGAAPALSCASSSAFTTKNGNMTLNADCTASSTVLVQNGYTLNGNGHTITAVDPTSGAFDGAVVQNAGTTMNVKNLTINGASTAIEQCGNASGSPRTFNGVAFMAAGGSISNVTLNGIGLPATGCQLGRAIVVRDATSQTKQSVTISNNTVSNYNKNGIDVRGNVAAAISGNTVTTTASGAIARNGIVVGDGASAQVWSNTVSGNFYAGSDTYATGLLVFGPSTVSMTKGPNMLSNNQTPLDQGDGTIVGTHYSA